MRLAAWPPLLLLLLLPLLAGAQLELPTGAMVELSADELSWEGGIAVAEGNVRVVAGSIHVRAQRVHYDPDTGIADFDGGLTFVDGTEVATAERGTFDLTAGTGTLEDVSLYSKKEAPPPEAVLEGDAAGWGHNDLTVQATRVEREADGAWVATNPVVTTCDCGDEPPSWTLGAKEATVVPGESVRLKWPVLKGRGVPLAALPWLSLPLSERKTGLLPPDVNLSTTRGFSYEQPLFLVLGRSWDATVTAGYFFGNEDRAFRGPRVGTELRYVPRIGTEGRAFASWARDLSDRTNATGGTIPADRWVLQLEQMDDWGGGLSDRIDVSLLSDRNYLRDFTEDVVLRDDQSLRSSAWLAQRRGAGLLVAEGVYLQDLRPAVGFGAPIPEGFVEGSSLFGDERRNTFARLPAFAADVARLQLPGNLGFSLHLGAARFAPLTAAGFGDEGLDGLGPGDTGWPGPDFGEGNGLIDPGERLAVNRLSLRPTLTLPVVAGPWVAFTPWAGWRQQIYLYDDESDGAVGWGAVGANLKTEVARNFGSGIRHAWIPALDFVGLFPGHEHGRPIVPYDELDVFPERSFSQLRATLGTRLDLEYADRRRMILEARVGQEMQVAPEGTWGESLAEARVAAGPLRLAGLLRWLPEADRLTEVAADATLGSERGDELRLGYRKLAEGGSLRLRAGPDQLFAPQERSLSSTLPFAEPGIEQIRAGATVVPFRGLSLRYDLLFLPTLDTDRLLQQRAGFTWLSSCDCWSVGLDVLIKREGTSWTPRFELGGLIRY